VPSGSYVLRLQVNPDLLIGESDYNNNEANCKMDIIDHGYYRLVTTKTCWLSGKGSSVQWVIVGQS